LTEYFVEGIGLALVLGKQRHVTESVSAHLALELVFVLVLELMPHLHQHLRVTGTLQPLQLLLMPHLHQHLRLASPAVSNDM